jgi:hypothetical protein
VASQPWSVLLSIKHEVEFFQVPTLLHGGKYSHDVFGNAHLSWSKTFFPPIRHPPNSTTKIDPVVLYIF